MYNWSIKANNSENTSFLNESYNFTVKPWYYLAGFTFSNETIGFIIFILFWYFAEKKEDFIYYMLLAVLGVPLGVYYLWLFTSQGSPLNIFVGLIIILLSVYSGYLALGKGLEGRVR